MSSLSSEGLSSREQRRLERDERKRVENASVEQRKLDRAERKRLRTSQTSSNVKKTPVKTDRTSQNVSSSKTASTGGHRKQSSSSAKRATVGSYDKINIIEKTAKFDSLEKENKGKPNDEEKKPHRSDSTRRKLGSKFLDNLSKFESQAKQQNDKETPFVRSYSKNHTAVAAEPSFRRSYRPSRTTPVEVEPTNLARRSLRKERVLDSISKFERKSSNDEEDSMKKSSSSNKKCNSPRPSSASSSKASLSDSGSTSSTTSVKGMTRAQQALERHKLRMRNSSQSSQNGSTTPGKPSSPSGKVRSKDSFRKPPKTPRQKSKDAKTPVNEKTRKISVTTTPMDGDAVEVTTVTEVSTPPEGMMNVLVKEIAVSEKETEKLLSPVDGAEYQLGDPRPKSVGETAAEFDKALSLEGCSEPASVRRKPLKSQEIEVEPKSNRQCDRSNFKLEENVVVIETSPIFKDSEILHSLSPSSDQIFHFSHNFNSNSNTDQMSREQNLLIRDEEIEVEPMKHDFTVQEQIRGIENRSYSSDEAIEVLRRLSEEIHSYPSVTRDKSCDSSNEIIHEEKEVEEDLATNLVETKREKRPASLHIEEVLYITKEPERRPKSSSPLKQFVNWTPVQHKSSVKLKKFSFESFPKPAESNDPPICLEEEAPRTPSPVTITDTTTEVPTSADSETRSPSPVVDPEISYVRDPLPEVKRKSSTETAEEPSSIKSFSQPHPSQNFSSSPVKSLAEPPKRVISPERQIRSAIKESLPDPKSGTIGPSKETSPALIPLPTDRPKSPVTHLNSAKSPVNTTEPLSKEMLATRTRNFPLRYKKSWLDESDDDNISVLSDAASDASSIDLEWLGVDSDVEDDFTPQNRKLSKSKKNSGVQRTASSAQDMLKMWEKKATEKKAGNRAPPSKVQVESKKLDGGVRAAWQSKAANIQSRSSESIGNGHSSDEPSEKLASTPSTPCRKSVVDNGSKADDIKEMQEIFDDKVSGKIQGAKAMFENLNQSPRKSPSLRRSPRKRVEPHPQGGAEDSPIISRKSSSSEIHVTSRKSSISQASDSSDSPRNDGSDELEDSPRVDNMRALFEQQAKRKPESKKLKTSLAEMVADDDCDITDVRSIKAMWESMDNGR